MGQKEQASILARRKAGTKARAATSRFERGTKQPTKEDGSDEKRSLIKWSTPSYEECGEKKYIYIILSGWIKLITNITILLQSICYAKFYKK